MAFGVKVQLGLADGAGASLHKKIQAALNAAGPIKLNKIGVGDKVNIASKIQSALTKQLKGTPVKINNIEVAMNKTVQRNMVRTIQNSLNSADATIKLNKIDASPALAGLKSDITNMLSGLTVGNLKAFLGADGVNEAFLKSAEEQEKALLAAQQKAASKRASTVVLDALEKQATSAFSSLIAGGADVAALTTQYNDVIQSIHRMRAANEEATADAIAGVGRQVDALQQQKILQDEIIARNKHSATAAEDAAKAQKAEAADAAKEKAAAQKEANAVTVASARRAALLHEIDVLEARAGRLEDGDRKNEIAESLARARAELDGLEEATSDVQNGIMDTVKSTANSAEKDIEKLEKSQQAAVDITKKAEAAKQDAQKAAEVKISDIQDAVSGTRKELDNLQDSELAEQLSKELDSVDDKLAKAARTSGQEQKAMIDSAKQAYKGVADTLEDAETKSKKAVDGLIGKYKELKDEAADMSEGDTDAVTGETDKSKTTGEIDAKIAKLEQLRSTGAIVSEAAIAAEKEECAAIDRSIQKINEKGKAETKATKEQERAAKMATTLKNRLVALESDSPRAYAAYKTDFDRIKAAVSMDGVALDKVKSLSAEFDDFSTRAKMAGLQGKSFFQVLIDGWKRFGTWSLVTKSFGEIVQGIQAMLTAVRDVDAAMTELKKVTDLTDQAYDNFRGTASESAREIGASLADTVNATADFARLGYDLQDSLDLAEAALTYKNVGDGITDISVATESLISTIKAFGIEASDSMEIVDKFNEVGRFCPAA